MRLSAVMYRRSITESELRAYNRYLVHWPSERYWSARGQTSPPDRHCPNRLQENVTVVQKRTLPLAPLFPMQVLPHVGHVAPQDRIYS